MDINYYRKINGLYKMSKKRDADIEYTKRQILQSFDDSMLAFEVSIDEREQTILVTYSAKDQLSKIISKPNETFDNGEIVTWENGRYLIYEVDPDKRIYTKGLMKKCVGTLKWQDEYGEIHEAWFARKTDVSPNFGIDDRSKTLTMPDERRQIIIQSNEQTQKFRKEQRFIVDGRAWKIITLDDVADGVINIVLEESRINPAKDNVELRVADYKTDLYKLVSKTDSNMSIKIDQTLLLDVTGYHNGISVETSEIDFSVDDIEYGTVSKYGEFTPSKSGQVKVTASYRDSFIEFNITIRDILVHNYYVDIIGDDSISFGQTADYQIIFKDSGTVIDEVPLFVLQQDSELATIVSTMGKTVSIKANSKNKAGNITLLVESENKLIKGSKSIRIKGYF